MYDPIDRRGTIQFKEGRQVLPLDVVCMSMPMTQHCGREDMGCWSSPLNLCLMQIETEELRKGTED